MVVIVVGRDYGLTRARAVILPRSLERLFGGVVIRPAIMVVSGVIHVILGGMLGSRKPVQGAKHLLTIRTLSVRRGSNPRCGWEESVREPGDSTSPLLSILGIVDNKDEESNETDGDNDANDCICGGAAVIYDFVSSHTDLNDLEVIGQFAAVCRGDVVGPALHAVETVVLAMLVVNFQIADDDIIDSPSVQSVNARIKGGRTGIQIIWIQFIFVNHGVTVLIMLDSHISFEGKSEVALEQRTERLVELLQGHGHHQVQGAVDGFMRFLFLAITPIPTTSCVVTSLIAKSIPEVFAAVAIVFSPALDSSTIFAIPPVKHALHIVASFVTDSVFEYVRTRPAVGSSVAVLPRIDAQVAISAIEVAMVVVALSVAALVSRLARTAVQSAIPLKLLHSATGRHVYSSVR